MQSPQAAQEPIPYSRARQGVVIATLGLGGLGAAFSQTVMVPIQGRLPELLGAPASETAWVITVTMLVAAIFTPVSGKLGDMFGKRRMAMVMMSFLILGSLVSATASGLGQMIVGRGLQGLSMGVIPLGMSLLRDVVDRRWLGTSIAIVSATLGVGAAIGLPLSAIVTEHLDWHMLFVFSAVLAAVNLALIWLVVPAVNKRSAGRLDIPGIIGLTVGLVGIMLSISRGNDWGWTSASTLAGFGIGFVALGIWA